MYKSLSTILDSGASISMFKRKSEATYGTYKKRSDDTEELAAGNEKMGCLGRATVTVKNMKLKNYVHVDGLNETLLYVGHICDTCQVVIFTKSEVVVLNTGSFSVVEDIIEAVVLRN